MAVQGDGGRVVAQGRPHVPRRQRPVPPLLQLLCLWGETDRERGGRMIKGNEKEEGVKKRRDVRRRKV